VLVWVAYAAALGGFVVAVRWWARRVDALGRARPFPWPGVSLLAAIALVSGIPVVLHHRQENRLGRVASALAGFPVDVHCQTFTEAAVDAGSELGFVRYRPDGTPEHSTLIKMEQCRHLAAYVRSNRQDPTLDQVVAVHILTHESMHMSGLTGESAADCAAVQRDAQTARLLGASPADAIALATRYWREVYPLLPDEYRSAACIAGGELDEHLPDAPWVVAQP
jgi:hypothetical protein